MKMTFPLSRFEARIVNKEYEDSKENYLEIDFIGEYESSSTLKSVFSFNDNVKKFLALFPNKKFSRVSSDKAESRFYDGDKVITSLVIGESYEEEVNATVSQ